MSIPSELLDVDAQIDVAYDEHAERFKLLAHVERLRILNILRQDAEWACAKAAK